MMLLSLAAEAVPPKKSEKQPVGCDSTSYLYYNSDPSVNFLYWEKNVRIAPPPPPQITVSPLVDSLCAILNADTTALFSIPSVRPRVPSNVVTFEINETEYLVGITFLKSVTNLHTPIRLQCTPRLTLQNWESTHCRFMA